MNAHAQNSDFRELAEVNKRFYDKLQQKWALVNSKLGEVKVRKYIFCLQNMFFNL